VASLRSKQPDGPLRHIANKTFPHQRAITLLGIQDISWLLIFVISCAYRITKPGQMRLLVTVLFKPNHGTSNPSFITALSVF